MNYLAIGPMMLFKNQIISVLLQWFGHSLLCDGAAQMSVTMTEDATRKTKKNLLKVQGVAWGASVAHNLWNAQEGYMKKDAAYAAAAGQAVLAALCLWKGFEGEGDE